MDKPMPPAHVCKGITSTILCIRTSLECYPEAVPVVSPGYGPSGSRQTAMHSHPA